MSIVPTTFQGQPIHVLTRDVIAQGVHTFCPGHVPAHIAAMNIDPRESMQFINYLCKLGVSPIESSIVAFIGHHSGQFRATVIGRQLMNHVTEQLMDLGQLYYQPPYSKPWNRRLCLIDYLDATLVRTDKDLTVHEPTADAVLVSAPLSDIVF